MKRIVFTSIVLLAVVSSVCLARKPASPLYGARLSATLEEWETKAEPPAGGADEPTWWPASLNPVSMCVGSACTQSYCFGSLCAESMCLGSGCLGSACIGSGCVGSVCAVSACHGETLCLRKCGHTGGPPNAIDPLNNGTTFVNGFCYEP
jgi:hypothetical protein